MKTGSRSFLNKQQHIHTRRFAVSPAAFVITVLIAGLMATGCEDTGTVGGAIEQPKERVVTTEVEITNFSVVSDDGFSGRLTNSAAGFVNDPFFGTVESAALMKPSISRQNIAEITDESEVSLRVVLNPEVYGMDTRVDYEIYEVGEIWRGNQLHYNSPVALTGTLVGAFTARIEDTIDIPLSNNWVQSFRNRFNNESADRDSLYRYEFPGLAIVAAGQNQRVHFFRHQTQEGDTLETGVTRLIVDNPEDSLAGDLPMLDWGSSMTRQDVPESQDSFILHNTFESVLKLEFDLDPAPFQDRQIVNVQLVFHENDELQTTGTTFVHPAVNNMRAHGFFGEPENLSTDMFIRPAAFVSTRNDDGVFKWNFTDIVLDHLFGESDSPDLYFSPQTNSGIFFSTKIFNQNGPENKTPRLVITSIKPED